MDEVVLLDVHFEGREVVKTQSPPDRIPQQGETVVIPDEGAYLVDEVIRFWIPSHRSFGSRVVVRLSRKDGR